MKRRTLRTSLAITGVIIGGMAALGGLATALSSSDDQEVVELLSGISYSPNKTSLDSVLQIEDLIDIAQDESVDADIGLRIRAYRALGVYETSDNKQLAIVALAQTLALYSDEDEGEKLLYLRASMLSLAQLSKLDAVDELVGLLAHPSRDIRAACAQALAITGSLDAVQPLQNRSLIEEETQVQLAIADALFALEE